jgi:hypothetical protein
MMQFEDFEEQLEETFDQADAIMERTDWRALMGQCLLWLAVMIAILIVFPLIGAGVYIAGKETEK